MLFLFKHRKRVQDFLDNNPKIELQKGYDRNGNVVAEAFVPDVFAVGGMKFSSPTIAITGALPKDYYDITEIQKHVLLKE